MFCANTRPGYQVSVYRTIGPLVFLASQKDLFMPFLRMFLEYLQANFSFSIVKIFIFSELNFLYLAN